MNVNSKPSDSFEMTYNIFYIDYGYKEYHVPISRVRSIRSSHLELPSQAIRCCLHGIVPIKKTWTQKSIKDFSKLLQEKWVICQTKTIRHIDHICRQSCKSNSTNCECVSARFSCTSWNRLWTLCAWTFASSLRKIIAWDRNRYAMLWYIWNMRVKFRWDARHVIFVLVDHPKKRKRCVKLTPTMLAFSSSVSLDPDRSRKIHQSKAIITECSLLLNTIVSIRCCYLGY